MGLEDFLFHCKKKPAKFDRDPTCRRHKTWSRKQLEFFDSTISSNPEQTETVVNILNRSSGLNAYILFGPPGTGKTVTLVESIKQARWIELEFGNPFEKRLVGPCVFSS